MNQQHSRKNSLYLDSGTIGNLRSLKDELKSNFSFSVRKVADQYMTLNMDKMNLSVSRVRSVAES